MTSRLPGRSLLTVLILIAGGELGARYGLGLGHPPLSQPHPTIEYLFKPNQDVYRFGNHFVTNRYGMRSADFPPQKSSPAELRIMVYGDSVINGGNLTDQSHLATSLVQQALARDLHRPVIVGNISAGSWGPPNQLAYLRQFGVLDADIVVLVLSSSDYDDAPTFEPLNPLTHPTEPPISALWEGVVRYLPRYFGARSINEAGQVPDPAQRPNKRDIEISLAAIHDFLLEVRREGARPLVLQHWTETEVHNQQPIAGYAEIRSVVTDNNTPIGEDGPRLRARQAAGRNPFRDDIHPNEEGQRVLADLLLEELHRNYADLLTATAP
jgi:hypothetical protein